MKTPENAPSRLFRSQARPEAASRGDRGQKVPCRYEFDPTCDVTLRDLAIGHDHAPILLLVTPRDRLLVALLQRDMLAPDGAAYQEAVRLRDANLQ